jgi:4-amino-4-deoxy-L-arabinose transferase-like glycosyltransferase
VLAAVRRRLGHLPPGTAAALIVLLALLLRLWFFVGLVAGDPQDDGIYYNYAFNIYRNGPDYFELFRHRSGDLANPIDQFHFRPMVTYPIAASFRLFGPGEFAAALWALVCSLGTVWVVYRLGTAVHGHATGLIAALLCAVYPVEVINATRILSDVQVGLFFALGLLLLVEGARRDRLLLCALAGASAGGAYLANARGLIAVGVLVASAALLAWRRRTSWRAAAAVAAGFIAVFLVEATIYYAKTGDPFLNYRIHSEAARFKYLYEPVETIRWWRLQIRYTNGEPLELIRTVFGLRDLPTTQFGVFFLLFAAAGVVSLWRRRNRLLLLVSAVVFAFLEFGAVGIAFDRAAGELQYSMIYKQPRFLMILSAPLLVIAADALHALWQRRRVAAVVILLFVAGTSLTSSSRTHAFYRGGLQDLRSVAGFVRAQPDIVFWSDLWGVEFLRIFTDYAVPDMRALNETTRLDQLRGSCLVLGGSRGVELLASYIESSYPPFIRQVLHTGYVPVEWRLVREERGPVTFQRSRDLRVYCVP